MPPSNLILLYSLTAPALLLGPVLVYLALEQGDSGHLVAAMLWLVIGMIGIAADAILDRLPPRSERRQKST